MGKICEQCGKEFKKIAIHWSGPKKCEHPSLSQHQREVATGLLMGDGSIENRQSGNPLIQSQMISENYLEYIDKQFGKFGNGVKLVKTATESAEHVRDNGFRPEADVEDYSDIYEWTSMRHPEFYNFADWYSSGEKIWPQDIELTPTVLKHWYCGDGHYANSNTSNHITISMSNEVDDTEKINSMFERVGLPAPNNYNIQKFSDGLVNCNARFTVEQSRELWDYMGEPLPDFEYKWPDSFK